MGSVRNPNFRSPLDIWKLEMAVAWGGKGAGFGESIWACFFFWGGGLGGVPQNMATPSGSELLLVVP